MLEDLLKYRSIAITFVIVILILVGIYFYGKYKGTDVKKPNPMPDDTPWGGGLTAEQATNVRTLTNRLYDDMEGTTVFNEFRDMEAFNNLLTSSDTIFVAVYNDFNDLHYSTDKGTLKQWIEDETFWLGLFTQSQNIKDALMLKFNRLNLD